MPTWNKTYWDSIRARYTLVLNGLSSRVADIPTGQAVPSLDDLTIGSGREFECSVLFFDIRNFTIRSSSQPLQKTLILLDTVLPTVMHIVHDHGGYVEKNTGDGVMAVFPRESGITDQMVASSALNAGITIFYALKNLVNPSLEVLGIAPVSARIGCDLGKVLIGRIGVARGAASHDRSFLTVVGPAANLACRVQQAAGTNEIWVGDSLRKAAPQWTKPYFQDVTPDDWEWFYPENGKAPYRLWKFAAQRTSPG